MLGPRLPCITYGDVFSFVKTKDNANTSGRRMPRAIHKERWVKETLRPGSLGAIDSSLFWRRSQENPSLEDIRFQRFDFASSLSACFCWILDSRLALLRSFRSSNRRSFRDNSLLERDENRAIVVFLLFRWVDKLSKPLRTPKVSFVALAWNRRILKAVVVGDGLWTRKVAQNPAFEALPSDRLMLQIGKCFV